MSGFTSLNGYSHSEPHRTGISYGDPTSGISSLIGIIMGLIRLKTTGTGCDCLSTGVAGMVNNIAEYAAAAYAEVNYPFLEKPIGNRDPGMWYYQNIFRCKDDPENQRTYQFAPLFFRKKAVDTWIAIAVGSDQEWESLCSIVGDKLRSLDGKTREARLANQEQIDAVLSLYCRGRKPGELAAECQKVGICASQVCTPLGLISDTHFRSKELVQEVSFPSCSWWPKYMRMVYPPIFSNHDLRKHTMTHAPFLGEHTRSVLKEKLGYSEDKIDQIVKEAESRVAEY
eukprot:gnl/MRDRNA2_/MRDRNA2_180647_c0_seq1.p1 gnl/MRDRNA2_/MRDRNA2_180647_c0~~gnl/MRDRNA2_/MRDRNA2_180647_c0_seq1.p1  ORF type:complete len:285 (+),score=41.51 gnl/MRDRNA2_/MRDRNA2_180647_c0_seq1:1-855(+)